MDADIQGQAKRGLAAASEGTRLRVARKGGIAPHNLRGLAAADSETRSRVAKAGGDARAEDKEGLRHAGRKGGEAVKAEYGIQFYQSIGEKGGESVKEKYGIDFYREIGEKGGGIVKEKYGPKFYREIAKHGSQTVKRQHVRDLDSAIGRKAEEPNKEETTANDISVIQ
jgi:general stress protein YciG